VAATVSNGNRTSLDTVTFNTGETANSILEGITLRGGRYGVYCTSSSSPTISKSVIRNNSCYGVYAVNSSSPTINDGENRLTDVNDANDTLLRKFIDGPGLDEPRLTLFKTCTAHANEAGVPFGRRQS
jgi:parallel beta-helix repeat protein